MITRGVGPGLSLAILGAAQCLAAAEATPGPPLPPHPRLLFSAAGLDELKARIAATPWAANRWTSLREAAVKRLAEPVELPPRGGNWSHNYVCPTHAARLKQGARIGPWQWEHICPVGPHTLKGDPSKATLDFDGNGIGSVHGDLAAQITDHALVWHLTGEAAHAERARAILMAYAERYRQYPLHDNRGRPGRGAHIYSQSLTEASWLITMAQGADLIWPMLSAPDRERAAAGLFRPAIDEIILPAKGGIHNIQCRHNSAIGLVGFLLDDADLIRTAIDNPERGYRQQMARGVQSDGVWVEGAWGYHFFTIDGLWPLTEAARNCGIDLYGPELKRLFDAPFLLAMPNLVLPAFNDSGEVSVGGQADLYELAYARYRDPRYVPLLAASERRGRRAFYVGVPQLADQAELPPRTSFNAEASGYAILQRGTDRDATWACLKYGPHGGGHGHPDKLNLVLYARGRVVLPDVGTKAYSSPLHGGWDKTTLAHNTLVIDQASQAAAQGSCLAFGTAGEADYAIAAAGKIYDDVRFTRTVALLTPELIVVVDQVRDDVPRLLDLAWHVRGTWAAPPAGEPWQPPDKPGYRYLTETRRQPAEGTTALAVRIAEDWTATLTLAADGPGEILTGTGVGKDSTDRIPIALYRRTAASAAFVTALHLDGAPVNIAVLPARDAAGQPLPTADAVGVRLRVAERTWLLAINPWKQALTLVLPDDPPWTTDQPFALR